MTFHLPKNPKESKSQLYNYHIKKPTKKPAPEKGTGSK